MLVHYATAAIHRPLPSHCARLRHSCARAWASPPTARTRPSRPRTSTPSSTARARRSRYCCGSRSPLHGSLQTCALSPYSGGHHGQEQSLQHQCECFSPAPAFLLSVPNSWRAFPAFRTCRRSFGRRRVAILDLHDGSDAYGPRRGAPPPPCPSTPTRRAASCRRARRARARP